MYFKVLQKQEQSEGRHDKKQVGANEAIHRNRIDRELALRKEHINNSGKALANFTKRKKEENTYQ